MVEATPTTSEHPSIAVPQVVELWGNGPIFPGPAWRLTWLLSVEDHQRLKQVACSGDLQNILRGHFPELAKRLELSPISAAPEDPPGMSSLYVIAGLAETLLHPARLERCSPLVSRPLNPPCLALRSDQHELAGRALWLSSRLTRAAYLIGRQMPVDIGALRKSWIDLIRNVDVCCRHPLTAALLEEARSRGIPAFLIDPSRRLYQLGTGLHGRWISSTSTDRDSSFGVAIASNKSRSRKLLLQLGLPVPREVRLPHHVTEEQLLVAARRIGFPCVLKPQDGEQGRGVTANITAPDELPAALEKAKASTAQSLLLQQHIHGDDFRLNVVNGDLVFVVKRSPPAITGDGVRTVAELIASENARRRDSRAAGQIAGDIDLEDPEVLAFIGKAGLASDSILSVGRRIPLRGNANISTGGLREEINPAEIHPLLRRQCIGIAKTLRLETCGIDYIAPDVRRCHRDSGGAFIEVNSMPQNSVSRAPMLLDHLFPVPGAHSIPVAVLMGEWDALEAAQLQAALAELVAMHPDSFVGIPADAAARIFPLLGSCCQEQIVIYHHPRELLINHACRSAVYLVSPKMVFNRGLPAAIDAITILRLVGNPPQPPGGWERLLRARADADQIIVPT